MGGERNKARRPRPKAGLYRDQFTDEERLRLTEAGRAGAADSLDEEIELVRVLIHRQMEAGREGEADSEAVGRLVDRLGRLYRTRQAVTGQGAAAAGVEPIARGAHRALREGRERAAQGGVR